MTRALTKKQEESGSPLNAKQARFVAEYLQDLNATQAYIRAGYSEKGAAQGAERLLRNVEVSRAVAAGQNKIYGKLELSAEKVLGDIESARSGAMGTEDWNAAIRASELQAKHLGLFEKDNKQRAPNLAIQVNYE